MGEQQQPAARVGAVVDQGDLHQRTGGQVEGGARRGDVGFERRLSLCHGQAGMVYANDDRALVVLRGA